MNWNEVRRQLYVFFLIFDSCIINCDWRWIKTESCHFSQEKASIVAATIPTQIRIVLTRKVASTRLFLLLVVSIQMLSLNFKLVKSKASPCIPQGKNMIERGFMMSLLKINRVPVSRRRKQAERLELGRLHCRWKSR